MAYAVRDQGVVLHGFAELNDALARIEGARGNFGVEYELQRRFRVIGEEVAKAAPQFVTHKTGRHGDPAIPRLEDSARVSVTKRSATVYSIAEHGGVQNVGGGPHAGWAARGPHVQAKNASHWMSRAVASKHDYTNAQLDGLLDWIEAQFMAG